MELFLLYVWLKLDAVLKTMDFLIGAGLFGIGVGIFMWFVTSGFKSSDEEDKATFKQITTWWRRITILVVCLIGLQLLIPSSKQMAYLVGGYVALKLVDSPETQKIVAILRNKANEYLDAELAPKEKAK